MLRHGAGYKALYEDTKNKQEAYYADRVGRKLWATEKMYMEDFEEEMNQRIAAETDSEKQDQIRREYEIKAYEAAKSDLRAGASHSVLEDREESLDQVAPLRYVLEASGMDTSLLSMSVDPESYTFGDFFSNIADFGFIKELNKKSCSDLKKLSVEAFNQAPDDILENYSVNATESCQNPWDTRPLTFGNEQLLEDLQVASLADARDKLRNDVRDILNSEGCAGCHAYGVKGAPPIPFSNMNALDRELTNSSGEIGNLAQRVWNRVSRVDGQHGVMPLGGPPIDEEDKEKIKQYFETFDSPYARRIEVVSGNIIDLNTRDGVSFSTEANTSTMNPVNVLGIPESGNSGSFFGGGGLGGFPGGDQKKTLQNKMQNKEVLQNGVVGESKITENNVDAVLQESEGFGF
ncbi:hypothetical protein OAT67_09590 [Bacteriovoracaceae bacterium]|nr:hypothetical protein [Bacteriovoracaceae bacterium]